MNTYQITFQDNTTDTFNTKRVIGAVVAAELADGTHQVWTKNARRDLAANYIHSAAAAAEKAAGHVARFYVVIPTAATQATTKAVDAHNDRVTVKIKEGRYGHVTLVLARKVAENLVQALRADSGIFTAKHYANSASGFDLVVATIAGKRTMEVDLNRAGSRRVIFSQDRIQEVADQIQAALQN